MVNCAQKCVPVLLHQSSINPHRWWWQAGGVSSSFVCVQNCNVKPKWTVSNLSSATKTLTFVWTLSKNTLIEKVPKWKPKQNSERVVHSIFMMHALDYKPIVTTYFSHSSTSHRWKTVVFVKPIKCFSCRKDFCWCHLSLSKHVHAISFRSYVVLPILLEVQMSWLCRNRVLWLNILQLPAV